jgi:hypothetical protein
MGNKISHNKFIIFLSKILLRNIHPIPTKRYSINETIQVYNKFLNDFDMKNVKTYGNIVDIYSKNKNSNLLLNEKKFYLTKKMHKQYNG